MNVSVFSCSTGYTSMIRANEDGGISYVNVLQQQKEIVLDGIWINGLTILHVRRLLPRFLKNKNPNHLVIIHVGIVETITTLSQNFLYEAIRYQHFYGSDAYFGAFVSPRMLKAGHALIHGREEYYSFLEPYQIKELFNDVAIMLEGFNVVMMGMSCPLDKSLWIHQASITNDIIRETCLKYNFRFIDVWNMCNDNVVDSNHLTEEGHQKIMNELLPILGE